MTNRLAEFARDHKEKSKRKDDYHARMWDKITGRGDYIGERDAGDEWQLEAPAEYSPLPEGELHY
jgi:hypothetical protein